MLSDSRLLRLIPDASPTQIERSSAEQHIDDLDPITRARVDPRNGGNGESSGRLVHLLAHVSLEADAPRSAEPVCENADDLLAYDDIRDYARCQVGVRLMGGMLVLGVLGSEVASLPVAGWLVEVEVDAVFPR